MARPVKSRRICSEPDYDVFTPHGIPSGERIILNVDEYESIRLVDLEGCTQQECAAQMNIARTTVTALYDSARRKIADSIVNGKDLCISGGKYHLCDGRKTCSSGKNCGRGASEHTFQLKGETIMRIAVTYDNGEVFQHFGHTEQFKVYDVEDNKIAHTEVVDTNGQGHGALAGFLFGGKVDVLICGGIGGGAQAALAEAGIKLFGGVHGSADAAVDAFLTDKLAYNPDVQCNHHHHEEGHSCGENHQGCGGSCH